MNELMEVRGSKHLYQHSCSSCSSCTWCEGFDIASYNPPWVSPQCKRKIGLLWNYLVKMILEIHWHSHVCAPINVLSPYPRTNYHGFCFWLIFSFIFSFIFDFYAFSSYCSCNAIHHSLCISLTLISRPIPHPPPHPLLLLLLLLLFLPSNSTPSFSNMHIDHC
jgi:hypothetical protein